MTRRESNLYARCALLTICSCASFRCIFDRRTTIRAYMVSPPTESGSGGEPRGRGRWRSCCVWRPWADGAGDGQFCQHCHLVRVAALTG